MTATADAVRGAREIHRADTATKVPPAARGGVLVCGSHGGEYAGWLLARAGVAAAVLHDAGVGREAAGIGSLARFAPHGFALATVSGARIGDAGDMVARGVVSHANDPARACGVAAGMACADAAARLASAPPPAGPFGEHAELRRRFELHGVPVVCVDSASLVTADDDGCAIFCGSHGGVVASQPQLALRAAARLAVYNDAGGGAGCGRLALLDERGIAAATVAASSARIGDGRSTFEDGILSAVNAAAARLGLAIGMPARDVVKRLG